MKPLALSFSVDGKHFLRFRSENAVSKFPRRSGKESGGGRGEGVERETFENATITSAGELGCTLEG